MSTHESRKTWIHGIDISHWQDPRNFNWTVVGKNQGFAYFKATEGVGYTDPAVYAHSDGAIASGIPFGFYHFARPGKVDNSVSLDGQQEARAFKKILNKIPQATLPPVLDLEKDGGLSKDELYEWVVAFMKELEIGIALTPYIYVGYYFVKSHLPQGHDLGATYALWLPQYNHKDEPDKIPHGWQEWMLWQYSDQGEIGVTKRTVLNVDTNWAKPEFLQCL